MKQRGKERLPSIPVSLLPVPIGESLSQTMTSHFEPASILVSLKPGPIPIGPDIVARDIPHIGWVRNSHCL